MLSGAEGGHVQRRKNVLPCGSIREAIRDARVTRPQKITFREMRASGVGGDCADYKCGHRIVVNADQWFDETQLSDLEDRFVCMVCGQRGPDVGSSSVFVQRSILGKPPALSPLAVAFFFGAEWWTT